ncbi:hypothetical protein ACS0TY_016389 [Phlomoides rotata]
MIEEFISRILILAFGYAYPAFQCFKTIEKNKVGIPELRYWCQYWIIVAVLTVLEIFFDVLISWLPLYRGVKLMFFIYLWYPSTKGSTYVYETLLQPYVAKHERDIDRNIGEVKERALNWVINYCHNCADMSSKKAMQLFQFMLAQCLQRPPQPQQSAEIHQSNEAPTPTPPCTPSAAVLRRNPSERRPPVPPPGASALHRSLTTKSESFNKIKIRNQTQFIHSEDIDNPDSDSDRDFLAAKGKLRHVKSSKIV